MKQKVVIIGHGFTSRLGIIRSLAELNCDITVIAIVAHNWLGRYLHFYGGKPIDCYSRHVKRVFYCNYRDEHLLLRILKDKCAVKEKKVIIIPDSDLSAEIIDRNQAQLKDYFLFPHINHTPGALGVWMRKNVQKELASRIGLNVPYGCSVALVDGRFIMPENIHFPCFMKPLESIKGGKGFFKRCDNELELQNELDRVARIMDAEFLIEEYKAIDREYALVGFSDGDKVIIPGIIQMLVNSQSHFGIAREGRIVPNTGFEGILEQFKSMVRSIGFCGLFDIDFYESDGKLYFGEINLRYGGSGYAYTALGVNLPAMLVRTLCGESIEGMQDTVAKEATYVNERVCIDDWVSGTLSKQDMHRIINSANIRFVYDVDDPEPQRQLMRYIRILAIKRVLKKYI